MTKMIIYVLKLEENKYYIGKTYNLINRIINQYDSNSSEWTKKYKVIEVFETIRTDNFHDEDRYVIQYMNCYGIENVRGGSYSNIILEDYEIHMIHNMIKGSTDACYKCGRKGHFTKNCRMHNIDKIINSLNCEDELITEIEKTRGIFNMMYDLDSKIMKSSDIMTIDIAVAKDATKTVKIYNEMKLKLRRYKNGSNMYTLIKNGMDEVEDKMKSYSDIITIIKASNLNKFNFIDDEDYVMNCLEIRKWHMEIKQLLKTLCNEYGDTYIIEELLSEMYIKLEEYRSSNS